MKALNDIELGYLAGMIDAECHVGIQRDLSNPKRKTPSYTVRFELAMTDKTVIDYVRNLLPTSKTIYMQAKGRRLPYYRLRLTTREATEFLRYMQTYVVGKKKQIGLILQLEDLRRKMTPDRVHNGKSRFQQFPKAFVEEADKIFYEFRRGQLNKKPRKK